MATEKTTSKTYKREAAGVMLLFLAGLFLWGIYDPSSRADETAEFLTLPVFTFAGAAFSLDAVFKQGGK
jgi:hypothetical protein